MAAPTIAEMLKYANLQMAAEALYSFDTRKKDPNLLPPGDLLSSVGHDSGVIDPAVLTSGNEHASRFTATEAAAFVAQWEVVDHLSNTTTGFSGTLFKNKSNTNELVLSIRSTEFIDDVVRDCVATNAMELKAFGWAFGQINDMEAWYANLSKPGGPLAGKHFSVTGYSLGAHLATAFNLLRRGDGTIGNVDQVVTFNGAGVGQVTSGTLSSVMADFKAMRSDPASIATRFSDERLGDLYNTLRLRFADGHKPTAADYALIDAIGANPNDTDYQIQQFAAEKNLLHSALKRIETLKTVAVSLQGVTDTKDGAPAKIPDGAVAQEGFEYQMAVLWAQEGKTEALASPLGILNALTGKSYGSPLLSNQYDIVGRETTTQQTAMVSDSQWHYGKNVDVFIEDQPLVRGTVLKETAGLYWDTGSPLPINNYTNNDFGDTHSLPLIVDSLAIQNTLYTLDASLTTGTLSTLLKAASNAKAQSNSDQGQCEGDVLENVLNGLCKIVMGSKAPEKLVGSLVGNTWAVPASREKLYANLKALTDVSPTSDSSFKDLIGKVTLALPDANQNLKDTAKTDFASLLTLLTLSPVAIKAKAGSEAAVATALQAKWDTEYTGWKADQDLTPAQRAEGQGTYTDRYLEERARMVNYLVKYNQTNGQRNVDPRGPAANQFMWRIAA